MKKLLLPAVLAAAFISLTGCSSSDDGDDEVSTISLCARSTYTSYGSTSTDDQPCLFYIFPKGNYVNIKREGTTTGYGSTISRVNAYAFTSAKDSVAAIGVANYTTTGGAVAPVQVNGYENNGDFWTGNYTVVAIPYDLRGVAMHIYSCYMMTDISKPKRSSIVFLQPTFNKNDLYDKYDDGGTLTRIAWQQ